MITQIFNCGCKVVNGVKVQDCYDLALNRKSPRYRIYCYRSQEWIRLSSIAFSLTETLDDQPDINDLIYDYYYGL